MEHQVTTIYCSGQLGQPGQFILVDAVTLQPVSGVAPFATIAAAQAHAGPAWDDSAAEAHYGL